MPYETDFDRAFTVLLGKAQGTITPTPTPVPGGGGNPTPTPVPNSTTDPCALMMNFDGVGTVLRAGMGGIPQVPQGSFTITGCKITSGAYNTTRASIVPVNCTATINIQIASQGHWSGGSRKVWGSDLPTIFNASEADVSVAGWDVTEIQPGDILPFSLVTFSGAATVLTVTLQLRRFTTVGIGTTDINSGSNTVTDTSGNHIILQGTPS